MGGREVSRPYQVWFFAEGERFLSFWRCHRPHWGGRRWCEALASLKGCFFYVFVSVPQYFSNEPITLPTAQYHHTPKRLTKTDSHTRITTRNFTENQQVAFFFTKFTTLWTTTL